MWHKVRLFLVLSAIALACGADVTTAEEGPCDDCWCGGWYDATTELVISYEGTGGATLTVNDSCAYAFARTVWDCVGYEWWSCDYWGDLGLDDPGDGVAQECESGSGANASMYAGDRDYHGGHGGAHSLGDAGVGSSGMGTDSALGHAGAPCTSCKTVDQLGYARATVQFNVTGAREVRDAGWEATLSPYLLMPYHGLLSGNYQGPHKVIRQLLLVNKGEPNETTFWLISGGTHYAKSNNLTCDAVVGNCWGEVVLSGGLGGYGLDAVSYTYDDRGLDVSGNARFNQGDVSALSALLGSQDPDVLEKWDFTRNDIIDTADVAFLETLVDAGLDSGILGDYDQDGDADCDDWEAMQPFPMAEFGDPDYRIELDADVDGVTDETDLDAIVAMFGDENENDVPDECEACPCGDINRSGGVVNLVDYATFSVCFGLSAPNPPGCDEDAFECSDLNGNGTVNLVDFNTFSVWFGRVPDQTVPDC